jgi:radical SAM protein with 4Fe4S-binding SPASM domain
MRSNLEELPDAIRVWGPMGVRQMDCNYLSLCNGIDRGESLFFHQEETDRVFAEARRAAADYPNLKLNLPRPIRDQVAQQAAPKPCPAPWRFVKIDTNGHVLSCHRAYEALRMGKLYDDDGLPFREVWNSPGYQALRRTVNDDTSDKHYAYCGRCELRYGWGDEAAHLGDSTWLETIGAADPARVKAIDHRRKKRVPLA